MVCGWCSKTIEKEFLKVSHLSSGVVEGVHKECATEYLNSRGVSQATHEINVDTMEEK